MTRTGTDQRILAAANGESANGPVSRSDPKPTDIASPSEEEFRRTTWEVIIFGIIIKKNSQRPIETMTGIRVIVVQKRLGEGGGFGPAAMSV